MEDSLKEISIWIEANRDVSPQSWEEEIWPHIEKLIQQRERKAYIEGIYTGERSQVYVKDAVREFAEGLKKNAIEFSYTGKEFENAIDEALKNIEKEL